MFQSYVSILHGKYDFKSYLYGLYQKVTPLAHFFRGHNPSFSNNYDVLAPVSSQTSSFSCAKPNGNQLESLFQLIVFNSSHGKFDVYKTGLLHENRPWWTKTKEF